MENRTDSVEVVLTERRVFDRAPGRLRVEYASADWQGRTHTEDVSASGIAFRTRHRFAVGDSVRLQLHFDEEPVKLLARVTRVAAEPGGVFRVGMQFNERGGDPPAPMRSWLARQLRRARNSGVFTRVARWFGRG